MKPVIFLLLSHCISFGVVGQIKNLEIKAAANSAFIKSASKNLSPITLVPTTNSGYTQQSVNLGAITESYKGNAGMEAVFSFQVWEYKNFFLRTGIGIQYLRFQRSVSIDNQLQNTLLPLGSLVMPGNLVGNPYGAIFGSYERDLNGNIIIDTNGIPLSNQPQLVGSSPNLGKTTALYLQLPVSIGRMFFSDKLIVSANLQTQFLAQATVVKEQYPNGSLVEDKDKSSDGFNNTLFLIGVECAYKIIKPIYISIGYNRSLTPIYDEAEQIGGKTFYNNVSLGLNYSIRK